GSSSESLLPSGAGSPPAPRSRSPGALRPTTRPAVPLAVAARLLSPTDMLTILITDDEPHVVELVRVTLEDDRVRGIEALDGATALGLADELEPELIFLDVNLPDLSGIEVCRRLRRHPRLAGSSIVMLTAAAQQEDISRGLAAGGGRD